ncbi:MAG: hypothetical protein H6670_15850 [Anaerolineaceae bacterium]|nr:hypothetical protein [Anaerolineaceae bacterium]
MANTDRGRKLLVRSAMVTSTTIATLVGSQNLAMLDARAFQLTATPQTDGLVQAAPTTVQPTTADTAQLVPTDVIPTQIEIVHSAPDITILRAAPDITILQQSGTNLSSQPAATSNVVIQPPVPAEIAPPEPIVMVQPQPAVQNPPQAAPAPQPQPPSQPVQQPSRSSR